MALLTVRANRRGTAGAGACNFTGTHRQRASARRRQRTAELADDRSRLRQVAPLSIATRSTAKPSSASALRGNITRTLTEVWKPLRSSSMASCTPRVSPAASMRWTPKTGGSSGRSIRRSIRRSIASSVATPSIAASQSGRASSLSLLSMGSCSHSRPTRARSSGQSIRSSTRSAATRARARPRSPATSSSSGTQAQNSMRAAISAPTRCTTGNSRGDSLSCQGIQRSRSNIQSWKWRQRPGIRRVAGMWVGGATEHTRMRP